MRPSSWPLLGAALLVVACTTLEIPPRAGAPSLPIPPVAILETPAGREQAGVLGSYTFAGTGSDSPWLPADALVPVEVPAGAAATIRLEDRIRIAAARALAAGAADRTGEGARAAGIAGPDVAGLVRLTTPGPGSWVVMVELTYEADVGSGAYYWRLEVR